MNWLLWYSKFIYNYFYFSLMKELQTEIYLTSLVVLVATLSILFYQKMSSRRLLSVDFEVFGRVQGIYIYFGHFNRVNNILTYYLLFIF